jgi:hypothetical protein
MVTSQNTNATLVGGLFFDLLEIAPHTGQSSQLFLDHDHTGAQFLATVARSALICRSSS